MHSNWSLTELDHSYILKLRENYEVCFEMIWNRLPCAPSIFQPHALRDTRVFVCLTKTYQNPAALLEFTSESSVPKRFSFTNGGQNKPHNRRLIEIDTIPAVVLTLSYQWYDLTNQTPNG
jgi:hypothetical protein